MQQAIAIANGRLAVKLQFGQPRSPATRAQRSGRETERSGATACNPDAGIRQPRRDDKSLSLAKISDATLEDARRCETEPHRARTCDPLIKSQHESDVNPCQQSAGIIGAAQGAAVHARLTDSDGELDSIVTAWPTLPSAVRVRIVAMVSAAGGAGSAE